MGTTHLPYLLSDEPENFLRSAAHEGVLRAHSHSELPLCFGSLSVATLLLSSINAGQSLLICVYLH